MTVTLPPTLPGLPMFGSAFAFLRDPVAVVREGRERYGPVFAVRMGPKRAAVVVGPRESRQVIALPETTLAVRPVYQWVTPMFGEVMQAAPYERYAEQRAALLPAFHGRNHGGYLAAMVEEIVEWLAALGPSGRFDAVRDVERLAFGVAMRLFLGQDFRRRQGATFRGLFLDIAAGMQLFGPAKLPTPRLLRRDRAKRRVFALLQPYLSAVRADPDPAVHGFLAHLVAGPFDDETVTGLILILVYAAYETTAAQLAWALIALLQHREQVPPVVSELDAALPEEPAELTVGVLHHLDHLSRCLLEAQRLRPVTTMLTRHTASPYEVAGFTVPVGWQTLFCPPVTHRDPDLYPEPDTFDPDRFSGARDPGGQAAAGLLNLGGGGHACLGGRFADIEMKAVLGLLLRSYELDLDDPDPKPAKGLGLTRPASPCLIRYRRRTLAS